MRPSFKSGIDKYKDDKTAKTLTPPQKLTTADIPARPAFSTPPHIARKIDNFERLRQLQQQREGIKVQFGPSTTAYASKLLSKVIGVEMPDPNNPHVRIKKDVSIAELLKTQTGRIEGLTQLLAMYMIMRQRQGAASGGVPQTQQQQEMEQTIAAFGMKILESKLASGEDFTKKEAEEIAKASSLIIKSDDPTAIGLPLYVSEKDLYGNNASKIYAYILKPKKGQPGLTPLKPIYELDGTTPLNINRIGDYLRHHRDVVIDLLNNRVVREEMKPQKAPTNLGKRIKQDLQKKSRWELDIIAKDNYKIQNPERYKNKTKLINEIMDEIDNQGIQHALPPEIQGTRFGEEEEKYEPYFTFSERGRPPTVSIPRIDPFRPFDVPSPVERGLRERSQRELVRRVPRTSPIKEEQQLQYDPSDPQRFFTQLQEQSQRQQERQQSGFSSVYQRSQSAHFW